MSLDYERSAGVIPFRFGLGRCLSYLVIHSARVRNPRARWEFPKGRIEPGESPDQAAAREFQEETGITSWAFREGFDRDVSYTYIRNGRKHLKTVTYFIAEVFDDSAMALSVEHIVDVPGVGIVGARSTRFRTYSVTRRLDVWSPRPTPGFVVAKRIVPDRILITEKMRTRRRLPGGFDSCLRMRGASGRNPLQGVHWTSYRNWISTHVKSTILKPRLDMSGESSHDARSKRYWNEAQFGVI